LYCAAVLIFAASRAVVIIGVIFGKLLVAAPTTATWEAGGAWYYRLLRWDSGWYASIMESGYRYPADASNAAFYPLYPLVCLAVKWLFGVNQGVALLIVANVAAVAAVCLMTKFVKDELGSDIALLSVALFSFFPSSLFLSAGYSESLFLASILLSFVAMTKEKFLFASAMIGASLSTRAVGIVAIPTLLWEIWRNNRSPLPQMFMRMAICAVVAASGLLFFMAYLGIKCGNPLAFIGAQEAWHAGTFSDRFFAAITLAPSRYSSANMRGVTLLVMLGLFIFFLALKLWSFSRLRLSICFYALGTLVLPYLTLGITGSMNRFVLMCFPAFMSLGIICNRRFWLIVALMGIFAAGLLFETAMFSQGYSVG
jgi:hypothetical protein